MAIIPDFSQLTNLANSDWLTGWDLSESEMFKISADDLVSNFLSQHFQALDRLSGELVRSDTQDDSIGTEGIHTIFGSNPGNREISDPDAAGNPGRIVFVKNQSTEVVAVTSSGSNQFYTYQVVNSVPIDPGGVLILWSDGVYWNTQ